MAVRSAWVTEGHRASPGGDGLAEWRPRASLWTVSHRLWQALQSVPSAVSGNVCPSRSGVRCVLSVCRPQVIVLDVLGLAAGAARVRAGRRDGANVACWGTRIRFVCAHVLVAEDDEMQAELIRRSLLAEGHRATVVHDGAAALDAARRLRPHIRDT